MSGKFLRNTVCDVSLASVSCSEICGLAQSGTLCAKLERQLFATEQLPKLAHAAAFAKTGRPTLQNNFSTFSMRHSVEFCFFVGPAKKIFYIDCRFGLYLKASYFFKCLKNETYYMDNDLKKILHAHNQ